MSSSGVQTCADRKSTRLNSSHTIISYAVFCLKKKTVAVADRVAGHRHGDSSQQRVPRALTPLRAADDHHRSRHLLHLACFFFNDTATTEIYTLSLHDALPI